MLDAIWIKVKAGAKFVWNWLTVIASLITTALSFGVDLVMSLPGDQLSIVMQPSTAMKVTAVAALLKAAIETIRSQMAPRAA